MIASEADVTMPPIVDVPAVKGGTVMRAADLLVRTLSDAGVEKIVYTSSVATLGLPAGGEIEVVEQRESWSRIALADGTRGWLKSHAVEQVVP